MAMAALAGAAVVLMVAWPDMLARLRDDLRGWMVLAPLAGVSPWMALASALYTLAVVVAPVLAAAFLCAVVAGLVQTRAMISAEPLKPRLGRLSLAGQGAGGRAYLLPSVLVRVLGVATLGVFTLWQHGGRLLSTAGEPPAVALSETSACLMTMALRMGLLLLALAALDVVYQRWAHGRSLRMSRHEVRMERRETEGDPGRRAQRRRLHQEILAAHDLETVKQADCVISGGPGLAAAISYDGRTMTAPRLLISGAGKLAASIRAEAHYHGRPVVHNRPLARALALVEPGTEIPRRLWEEAADVLREVRDLAATEKMPGTDHRGRRERKKGRRPSEENRA